MYLLAALVLFCAPAVALAEPPAAVAEPEVDGPIRVAVADPVAVVPAMAVEPEAPAIDLPAAASPTRAGLDRRLDEDAAAGRAFVGDTGLTTPKGKVVIEARVPFAAVLGNVRYGITDRIEISGSALAIPDDVLPVGFGIKAQLYRTSRIAVSAGLEAMTAEGDTAWRANAAASMCADAACESTVTVMVNGLRLGVEDEVPVAGGLGWAVGRRVQFLGEIHHWRDATDSATFGVLGTRTARGGLAFDVGMMFAVITEDDDRTGGALPFFGVSGRL